MPDLNLIDQSDVYSSASSYSSPNFNPSARSGSAGSGVIYASMGASVISAIINGFTQANAYKAQGEYASTIAGTNAKIAQLQEEETLQAGDVAASRETLKAQQVQGALRASQGASGIDVSSASSVLARNAVRSASEQDALTIRNNAQRRAWGYKMQALNDTYAGKFAKLTASTQSDQSILTGGLKAVSGPLAIESNYLRWSRGMGGASSLPFPNAE